MENTIQCKPRSREQIIRWAGIILVSLIFPLISFDYPFYSEEFFRISLISVIRTALIWNGSMYIINYLVGKYSVFRQPARLIIYQVLALTVFVIVIESGEILAMQYFTPEQLSKREKIEFILMGIIITFMISSIYASVSFFMEWKANLLRAQALEKANLEARYEALRNQVNPHFLFNSLNTLLMMVADNPEAVKYIESISGLMRYMLSSRGRDVVSIHEELKIAGDYVYVQKSRFGEKLIVNFKVDKKYESFTIPPLTLQMLIENAVKHNVVSKNNPLIINIYVSEDEYLVVENKVQPKLDKEPSTGTGLENIRSRYLHVAEKEVLVQDQEGRFTVKLPLFEKLI